MRRAVIPLVLCSLLIGAALAADPATAPSDPTMDWLLSHATTAPTTTAATTTATTTATTDAVDPTTGPSAFAKGADPARPATLTLSDGTTVTGNFAPTLDQPIRVYVPEKKSYRDIPFSLIKSMQAKVLWERDERQWRFVQSGSDVKEYGNQTYPTRETAYTITLENGQPVTGSVDAPLYEQLTGQEPKIFVLHKRDKGALGQTLKDLVYIKSVEFN